MAQSASETESEYMEESNDDVAPYKHDGECRHSVAHVHASCRSVVAPKLAHQPQTLANSRIVKTDPAPHTSKFKQEDAAYCHTSTPVPAQSFVSPFASLSVMATGSSLYPASNAVKAESTSTELGGNQAHALPEHVCAHCGAPLISKSSYNARLPTCYCLCCKRPVFVSGLSARERSQRVVWRCPECTTPPGGGLSSDALLASLVAPLSDRLKNAVAIDNAEVAITRKIKKFQTKYPTNTSVFTTSPLEAIEQDLHKCWEHERDHCTTREQVIMQGIAIRDEVFAQWLTIKDKGLELAIQKIVVCKDLFERVGLELPESAAEYLASTGVFNNNAPPLREGLSMSCDGCAALLLPTPAMPKPSPAFCACCKWMVPLELMADKTPPLAPSATTSALCNVCHDARATKRTSGQPPVEMQDDRRDTIQRIMQLASIAGILQSMIDSAPSRSTQVEKDPKGTVVHHQELKRWKTYSHALHRRHCDMIRSGAASVRVSRQLYADQVAMDHNLLKMREQQIMALVQRMAELKLRLPRHTQPVVCSVYARHGMEVPVELFEKTPRTKSMVKHDPNRHIQCDGCHEQLLPEPKAKGSSRGFCDCCKRVLPKPAIAQMTKDACVSTCRTCSKTRSLGSLCYDGRVKKRLPPHHIDCLTQVIGLLRKTLAVVAVETSSASQDTRRLATEQELQKCKKRLSKINGRMNKALHRGEPPVVHVQQSQQLYADHMQANEATALAALDLVHILLEAMATHEMEISDEAKAMLAKLQIGSEEVPEVSGSNPRKRYAASEESDALVADSPSSQKRPRLANDREIEPGEISE